MPDPKFLNSLFSLENKVVVVTGAAGAIPGAIADALAQAGAAVALLDIDYPKAQAHAEKIVKNGGKAIGLHADVCHRQSLETACSLVVSEVGHVDCLVNGAGGNLKQATCSDDLSFFDLPLDAWSGVLDLNLNGVLLACQAFAREITKQKQGSILNIASIAGLTPLTRSAGYCAAKAAVVNFTKWLAVHMCQEYSPRIRVNAICPGFIATAQNKYLLYDDNGQLTDRGRTILNTVPQNRFGEPAELAAATIWLLSAAAAFATGSVITIDGGFSAYSGV